MIPKRVHPEEYSVINPKHLSVFGNSACRLIEMLNLLYSEELGSDDPPLFPVFHDPEDVHRSLRELVVDELNKLTAPQEVRVALCLYKAPVERLLPLVNHEERVLAEQAKKELEGLENPLFEEFFKYAKLEDFHHWMTAEVDNDEELWWEILDIEDTCYNGAVIEWIVAVAKQANEDFGTPINPLCYFDDCTQESTNGYCCIRMAFGYNRWELLDRTGKLRAYSKGTGYRDTFTESIYVQEE